MRTKFLTLLVVVFLSACSFDIGTIPSAEDPAPAAEPTTPAGLINATPMPFAESDLLTTTPFPFPTVTFAPTNTFYPTPANVGTYPIRFAQDGTYVDIPDTISNNTRKTYSIFASQGQVMSISVKLDGDPSYGYMTMRLTGADGSVLCPRFSSEGCGLSWRGVLPTTQEYYVELTPISQNQSFTLRVAINPPGTQTQLFRYVSPFTGASFSYTDEFAPMRISVDSLSKLRPEVKLAYIDTQAFVDRNLAEAYYLFGASTDSALVQDCLTINPKYIPNEQLVDKVIINGHEFSHSRGSGVATGNIYEQEMYRTALNGTCYEVTFLIHSFSTGAFLPQKVILEFDRAALMQKLESILATLILN